MEASLKPLLTHYDVADLLQMPAARVARMARARQIPCVIMPTGELLFQEQQLREWLAARTQAVTQEPGREVRRDW
jgi:hypothetical protein